ncbi:MAG: DUF3987 domain-containing protein, partial [Phycisphaerales bacterium]|nr:DUF3987 domain-containing protein [Phycisphaerales bacterium]
GTISKRWTYTDRDGNDLFHVVRIEQKAGGKTFRPIHHNVDGFSIADPPGTLPLYGAPELVDAEMVFIVEGEKCADAARSIGLIATTSAHGAKGAARTDWTPLAGRDVVVLPDNDDGGMDYAETVEDILLALNPPATVRILDLPDLEAKGDIADFIALRETDGKDACAIRREIEDLADLCTPASPTMTLPAVLSHSPYPLELLPEPVARFCDAVARMIGCEAAYVALPATTLLAGCIGNTHKLQIKRGFEVPSVLWGTIVAPAGTAKSPSAAPVIKPLQFIQRDWMKSYADEYDTYERETTIHRAAVRKFERSTDEDPPAAPTVPNCKRVLVHDATIEALLHTLYQNPRGLLMWTDELASWICNFDRYAPGGKGGSDRTHWQTIYDAGEVIVDRKSNSRGAAINVPMAAVSVYGGVQPGIIVSLMSKTERESGLFARLLPVRPPSRAMRWTDRVLSAADENKWQDIVRRIVDLPLVLDATGYPCPRILTLNTEARRLYADFYNEQADAWDQTEDPHLASAISKLRSTAARFALVLHITRIATGEIAESTIVSADTMRRGIELARWHTVEAGRVYSMFDIDDSIREQQRIVERIERLGGRVSVRDWQRKRSLPSADDARAELRALAVAGFGTFQYVSQAGRGRPTEVFSLHSSA